MRMTSEEIASHFRKIDAKKFVLECKEYQIKGVPGETRNCIFAKYISKLRGGRDIVSCGIQTATIRLIGESARFEWIRLPDWAQDLIHQFDSFLLDERLYRDGKGKEPVSFEEPIAAGCSAT